MNSRVELYAQRQLNVLALKGYGELFNLQCAVEIGIIRGHACRTLKIQMGEVHREVG